MANEPGFTMKIDTQQAPSISAGLLAVAGWLSRIVKLTSY
jgi:hypothetical protein